MVKGTVTQKKPCEQVKDQTGTGSVVSGNVIPNRGEKAKTDGYSRSVMKGAVGLGKKKGY